MIALVAALAAPPVQAAADRLVVGTPDAALVAALSVAFSSRGLTIVELPDALLHASDVGTARQELASHDGLALVWLCDDDAGAHALCFLAHDGRFVARPVTATSPVAPPDAAALALTVKILLWGAAPAHVEPAPAPSVPAAPVAPAPPSEPPPTLEVTRELIAPTVAIELTAGTQFQAVSSQPAALRLGGRAVFAPAAFSADRWLAVGAGVEAGPTIALGGAHVEDVALEVIGRGRERAGSTWLEVDLAPTLHVVDGGGRATALGFDARLGWVVPLGRIFVGARADGAHILTSTVLPRWSATLALIGGIALW
ncbi:MAG TPA: hypothetical protein VHJ20_21695 [Polyangia bacterium]|nr:hypothetical protein [Polyangia bacterium]